MNLPSKFVVHFFLALILPLASAHAQMRTWTASPAGHLEAEYVGLKDGVVSLKSSDGKVHRVRLDQLAAEDQKFVMDTSGWGRVWTKTDGSRFIADFVRGDLRSATMTGIDGKQFVVLLDQLSGFDRQYIAARSASGEAPNQPQVTGKVVGVTDGDTATVLVANRPLKVRFEGIDAPEQGQAFGNKAKQFVSEMIFGKEVLLRTNGKDRYGRTLGVIFVDGKDVNASIVEAGLAWHFVKYSDDPNLARLEMAAREARVGLWSEANPIPPWEWRRWGSGRQRRQLEVPQPLEAPQASGQDVPLTSSLDASPAVEVSANEASELTHWLNTHGNVRHNQHCRWFKKTKKGRMCRPNEGHPCGQCGG